jgi:hypothetical protein
MKKLIVIVAILFATNVKAQDTTYYYNHYELYRMISIKSKVVDTPTLLKYRAFDMKKQKRKDRVVTIVIGAIWAGLTSWYFIR